MPNSIMGGDGGRLCLMLRWGRRRETVPNAMVGGDGGRLCLTL